MMKKSLINEIDIDLEQVEALDENLFFSKMSFSSSFSWPAISAATMDTKQYYEINVITFREIFVELLKFHFR